MVSLFFFLSGVAALVYEIVWLRLLGQVFGNTTFAISTVLAAYMAGLGLGGWVFGRRADRLTKPLWAYGLLEGGIGLYAAFSFVWVGLIEVFYIALARQTNVGPLSLTAARFVLSAFLLFIPAFLMGATLPVLSKFFVKRSQGIGPGIAWLYSLNTAGATCGVILAGFWLLPAVGMRKTLSVAVFLNIAIGLSACLVSKKLELSSPKKNPAPDVNTERLPVSHSRLLLGGLFVSGFTAMVFEVGWTRILAVVLGSSTYAFSLMLATFLLGLGLGSAAYKKILSSRPASFAEWGWLQAFIAIAALATLPWYESVSITLVRLFALSIDRPELLEAGRFAVCGALMFVPTFCFGAMFPVSASLYSRDLKFIGRDVGTLYLSNTLGNITGSLAAGFILIPLLGIHGTLLTACLIGGAFGFSVLLTQTRGMLKRSAAAALLGLFAFGAYQAQGGWDPRILTGGLHIRPYNAAAKKSSEILSSLCDTQNLFYREGLNAVVNVGQYGDHRFLKVNGKTDASNGYDMSTQLLSGHLPHLLHPAPKNTLLIGFGSGTTLAAALAHPIRHADSAEIEPAVLEGAPFFDDVNFKSYLNPRATMIPNDGRNHLLISDQTYDVIISEPSNPWMSGTANLFTVEFYELVRQRLSPDGIFCQWLQAYSIAPRDFQMVVASVQKALPHVTLWQSMPGDILILASPQPIRLDLDRAGRTFQESASVRRDMARLHVHDAAALASFFVLDERGVQEYTKNASLHRDDTLRLEFTAPKALYRQRTSSLILSILESHRKGPLPVSRSETSAVLTEEPESLNSIGEAFLGQRGDLSAQKAKTFFQKALALNPRDVRALIGAGRSYLAEGSLLKATAYFQKAIDIEPDNAQAHASFGAACYSGGGIALALEEFNTAVRLDGTQADFIYSQAKAFEALGRFEEALASYRKTLALNPDSLEVKIAAARALRKAGHPLEAAEQLETLRSRYKTHETIYAELEKAYEATENFKSSAKAYEELVKINPFYEGYWVRLHRLYQKLNNPLKAEWALRQGRKTHSYFDDLI